MAGTVLDSKARTLQSTTLMLNDAVAHPPVAKAIRPVTIVAAPRLSSRFGGTIILASETFQYTGSFKFRAAYNVASQLPHKLLITASSGNFGQALAYACVLLDKSCIVVMPKTSAKVKVDAVREFGGKVELVDVRVKTREQRVRELAAEHPQAYVASAYDDPLVIEGNATLGEEICGISVPLDYIVAPIGGGGLTSGIISAVRRSGKRTLVIGAEPVLANDAARSLKAGRIIRNETEPETIADGTRTLSIGQHNWEILREGLADIIEVSEEDILEAVRLLFGLANLKAEPTGALSLAALLANPELCRGRAVCCVISGGNVGAALYRDILAG
jgi:threonine dehydratase